MNFKSSLYLRMRIIQPLQAHTSSHFYSQQSIFHRYFFCVAQIEGIGIHPHLTKKDNWFVSFSVFYVFLDVTRCLLPHFKSSPFLMTSFFIYGFCAASASKKVWNQIKIDQNRKQNHFRSIVLKCQTIMPAVRRIFEKKQNRTTSHKKRCVFH